MWYKGNKLIRLTRSFLMPRALCPVPFGLTAAIIRTDKELEPIGTVITRLPDRYGFPEGEALSPFGNSLNQDLKRTPEVGSPEFHTDR